MCLCTCATGLTSLVNYGLSPCEKGFGVASGGDAEGRCELYKGWMRNTGNLTYTYGEQREAHLKSLHKGLSNLAIPEAVFKVATTGCVAVHHTC